MAESCLVMPGEGLASVVGEVLCWPPESFRYDMRESELRERVNKMDVAGRMRHLVWGPYVVLPAGCWRARVRLAFDQWSCRQEFYFEFGSAKDFVRQAFTPGREGLYEIIADATWSRPVKAEARVVMIESSVGGMFEFLGASVEFCGDAVGAP